MYTVKVMIGVLFLQDQEPLVTNCDGAHSDGKIRPLCVDYIWYSVDSLDVLSVLDTPSVDILTKHVALPSELFPSDHVPLMAKFAFN